MRAQVLGIRMWPSGLHPPLTPSPWPSRCSPEQLSQVPPSLSLWPLHRWPPLPGPSQPGLLNIGRPPLLVLPTECCNVLPHVSPWDKHVGPVRLNLASPRSLLSVDQLGGPWDTQPISRGSASMQNLANFKGHQVTNTEHVQMERGSLGPAGRCGLCAVTRTPKAVWLLLVTCYLVVCGGVTMHT